MNNGFATKQNLWYKTKTYYKDKSNMTMNRKFCLATLLRMTWKTPYCAACSDILNSVIRCSII